MPQWVFSDKARRSIERSTNRLNIWTGSVRSGKTISSLITWILFTHAAPPGPLLMVGKTERTLKRNILDPLQDMVGSKHFKLNRGEGELTLYGRKVLLSGADDERAEGKIRGITLAGAYLDEVSLLPESFFKQVLARMSVRGARLFGTTNPDGPYHWLKSQYIDRADELNANVWSFSLDDNIALDPDYVEALKSEYQPGTLFYKRFIEGLWVAAEGAVFDMWNPETMVVDSLPREPNKLNVAIDYGTSNATVAGLFGSWTNPSPTGPRAVLLRSYRHSGRETGRTKTDAEYADDIINWLGDDANRLQGIIVDPSAASFKAELRSRGFLVRDAVNDVLDGIRLHGSMLHRGHYVILNHPSNKHVEQEYGAYLWDAKAQAKGQDKPRPEHDHAMDATRYYLATMFGTPGPSEAARARLSYW